jgi:hypothetical protein
MKKKYSFSGVIYIGGYRKAICRMGWLVCLLWAAGCATNTGSIGPGGDFSSGNGGPSQPEGAQTGSSCPGIHITQLCSCQNGNDVLKGRQTCAASSGWGPCECAAANGSVVSNSEAPGNKSSVTFNWEETTPAGGTGMGTCKAGHYVGTFDGFYNSPIMVASPVGIPVLGAVEFDLFQIGNGEYFEIRDGKMDGFALGFVPFMCDIMGTINCGSAQPAIEAYLKNGEYFVIAFPYIFDGKIVALYDKPTATVGLGNMGQWAVTEPTNYPEITRDDGSFDPTKATFTPLPPLVATNSPDAGAPMIDIFVMGGTGHWNAAWTGPATGVGGSVDGGSP